MKSFTISTIALSTTLFIISIPLSSLRAADEAPKYASAIDACLDARNTGTENSITDYVCPTGDFLLLHWREFTLKADPTNVAYQVVLSRAFNDLDKKVKEYLKILQEKRDKNPASWTEDIRMKFVIEFPAKYNAICYPTIKDEVLAWSKIPNPRNNNNPYPILTTSAIAIDGLSDSALACEGLVVQKMKAFQNISMMLAAQGVTKSYTNDKSTFMEKIKTKYDSILETWRNYVAALTKATDKWNAFIKTPSIAP